MSTVLHHPAAVTPAHERARLRARVVGLIESRHMSVAAAARALRVPLALAGALVCEEASWRERRAHAQHLARLAPGPAGARRTRLRGRMVAIVEREHASVAAAARRLNLPLELASSLVCEEAELREQHELEAGFCAEVYDAWDRLLRCEGLPHDWLAYSWCELERLRTLAVIPNQLIRERVEQHIRTVEPDLTYQVLAQRLARDPGSLRRSLGIRDTGRRRRGRRTYAARPQRTISRESAGAVLAALGIPTGEVPGL